MLLQMGKCILWNKQLTTIAELNTPIWHISPRIGKHMITYSFFKTQLRSRASKNFPTFMEWMKIQQSLTTVHHYTKWTQSTSSHHISLQSTLILYAHLCLGLSGLLPSGFLTEVGYISHLTVLDYLATHKQTSVIIVFSVPPLSFLSCPNIHLNIFHVSSLYIHYMYLNGAE